MDEELDTSSKTTMELSVREAATLMGRSPRAIRAQVAGGRLPGRKKGGRWRIPSEALPLDEARRKGLQAKAEGLRRAVERVLPSRTASTSGDRRRSVADLGAFRAGSSLLRELTDRGDEVLGEARAKELRDLVEGALLDLAEAAHHYDRSAKLGACRRCRAGLSRATGLLLLASPDAQANPVFGWLTQLEADALFLFGRRRGDLRRWRSEVAGWLAEERRLRLKHPEARALSCRGHLDALGYRIRRDGLTALPRATRRMQRRIHHELVGGRRRGRGRPDIERSLASSAGIVLFG